MSRWGRGRGRGGEGEGGGGRDPRVRGARPDGGEYPRRATPSCPARRRRWTRRGARVHLLERRATRPESQRVARPRRRVASGDAGRWRLGGGGGGQTRTRRQRMTWVLVAFIGLVGGVVSGLFGVGGAIVIVPALGLFVGAFIGAHLAGGVSDVALKRAFGGLLLLVAGKLLLG